jgi:hypothetical protein
MSEVARGPETTNGCQPKAIVGIAILGALIGSARKFGLRMPILAVGIFCIGPYTVPQGSKVSRGTTVFRPMEGPVDGLSED